MCPPAPKKIEYPDAVSYDTYIAWKRLTHSGKRSRDEMSAPEQAEWDALGITEEPAPNAEEARQAYLEVTRARSGPASGASA